MSNDDKNKNTKNVSKNVLKVESTAVWIIFISISLVTILAAGASCFNCHIFGCKYPVILAVSGVICLTVIACKIIKSKANVAKKENDSEMNNALIDAIKNMNNNQH